MKCCLLAYDFADTRFCRDPFLAIVEQVKRGVASPQNLWSEKLQVDFAKCPSLQRQSCPPHQCGRVLAFFAQDLCDGQECTAGCRTSVMYNCFPAVDLRAPDDRTLRKSGCPDCVKTSLIFVAKSSHLQCGLLSSESISFFHDSSEPSPV